MSVRKLSRPSQKVTLRMFTDAWTELGDLYPIAGASAAVRELIDQHLASRKAETLAQVKVVGQLELDLGEEM